MPRPPSGEPKQDPLAGTGRRPKTPGEWALSRGEIAGIVLIAAVPRLLGLGHISLWLDEILGTLQASGGFRAGLAAIRVDRVHPPAWFVLDWSWLQVSAAEPWRRLLPVALGILTVLLLADLASRWFGRRAALATAILASIAPFHVRYTQELRPYSLGLLFFVGTLWLVDRARGDDSRRSWILVALGLLGCFATLYLDALVVVPALLLVIDPGEPASRQRASIARLGLAAGVALLPMIPWLAVARSAVVKTHELQATSWSLDLVWRRWQFLTLSGREGEAGSTLSLVFALVALVGAAVALRSHAGRVTLLGFLTGAVGVEVVLATLGHWSNGRYSILAWPFLVLLLALGCDAVGKSAAWLWRKRGSPRASARAGVLATGAAIAGLAALSTLGLLDYYRAGRPDWRGAAAAVASLGPDLPLLAGNEWTRVSLGYYLADRSRDGKLSFPDRLRTPPSDASAALTESTESCAVLVDAGYPRRTDLEPLSSATPIRIPLRRTGARIAVLAHGASLVPGGEAWKCAPPLFETTDWERSPPFTGKRRSPTDPQNPGAARLDLDASNEAALLAGWSYPETTRDGTTFRWALGTWASFRIEAPAGSRIRFEVWPFGDSQVITLYRNHTPVGALSLRTGKQAVELELPERKTPMKKDVFHLRFSSHASPGENPRPLAAAFDRLELVR